MSAWVSVLQPPEPGLPCYFELLSLIPVISNNKAQSRGTDLVDCQGTPACQPPQISETSVHRRRSGFTTRCCQKLGKSTEGLHTHTGW